MNKKSLSYFFAIIIVAIIFVFLWLFISFRNYQANRLPAINNQDSQKYPSARNAADWNAPFLQKIEAEFMDKEDKTKMNLADDPMVRLQVLERDASGTPTVYKKIYKDEDIIEYVYDPNIASTSESQVVTSTPR